LTQVLDGINNSKGVKPRLDKDLLLDILDYEERVLKQISGSRFALLPYLLDLYQGQENENQLAQPKPSQHVIILYVKIFAHVSSLSHNNGKEGLLSDH